MMLSVELLFHYHGSTRLALSTVIENKVCKHDTPPFKCFAMSYHYSVNDAICTDMVTLWDSYPPWVPYTRVI